MLEIRAIQPICLSACPCSSQLPHVSDSPPCIRSAPELCEFLLVEYSSVLMTLQSLWQVALDYLSHCPAHGRHYMGLLVERIPLTTERKANKVIHLCQRYHLKDQSESLEA